MTCYIPRGEHPFPQLVREDWLCLNGRWDFEFDFECKGRESKLFLPDASFDKSIIVPFCPESELSGIGYTDFIKCVWYRKRVTVPESFEGKRVWLRFEACDYRTEVFVFGKSVGTHVGGYTPFEFDITDFIVDGEAVITVCAEDDVCSPVQASGKQCEKRDSYGCMYTRTTGIWQTVWLEARPPVYISDIHTVTALDGTVDVTLTVISGDGLPVTATAHLEGSEICRGSGSVCGGRAHIRLNIADPVLWDIGSPHLYGLTLIAGDDRVESYFGIREVAYSDHRFYINGKSVFQRLVLDQGFYPDGIYTARSDAELENDIKRSQAFGFNGARLHQKVFEPRFLYHCDRLGYIVWDEYPNWGLDSSSYGAYAVLPEWESVVLRDRSHPSVIGWCPFNECQANTLPELLKGLYAATKRLDRTRPVIESSGWLHIEGCCDMPDWHDYEQNPDVIKANYESLKIGRAIKKAEGFPFDPPGSELCFVSEFGGTRLVYENDEGWGYGSLADTEEFVQRVIALCSHFMENEKLCAFCYTQLTDVEQEQNGLYTYHRVPKFNPDRLKAVLDLPARCEQE